MYEVFITALSTQVTTTMAGLGQLSLVGLVFGCTLGIAVRRTALLVMTVAAATVLMVFNLYPESLEIFTG